MRRRISFDSAINFFLFNPCKWLCRRKFSADAKKARSIVFSVNLLSCVKHTSHLGSLHIERRAARYSWYTPGKDHGLLHNRTS